MKSKKQTIKPLKWLHSYDAEEARYDYWTEIRRTPLGGIFILISLTPKSIKSYVQEVSVWIGDGDNPVYQTKETIGLDVTRTIREIKGLQKNVLRQIRSRMFDTANMIGEIAGES